MCWNGKIRTLSHILGNDGGSDEVDNIVHQVLTYQSPRWWELNMESILSSITRFPDDLGICCNPRGITGEGMTLWSLPSGRPEMNCGCPKSEVLCEPQLGKRGLYPTLSTKGADTQVRLMMNFISYCDGEHTFDIAGEGIFHMGAAWTIWKNCLSKGS